MQREMGGPVQVFYNVTVRLWYFPSAFPKYDNQQVAQIAKPDRMTGVQTCSGVFLLFLNKPKKHLFPFSLCFFSLTEDLCSSSPPGQTQKSLLEQTHFCGQTSAVRKLLVQYKYFFCYKIWSFGVMYLYELIQDQQDCLVPHNKIENQ